MAPDVQVAPTYRSLLALLLPKQRAFVVAYLDCLNSSEAARRAGYPARSARQVGHENRTKPDIRAAIDAGMGERGMPREEVLDRLRSHAAGDMRDFLKTDTDGDVFWIELTADKPLHLIKKLKITKSTLGDGDSALIVETKVEIELYDAKAALDTLAKHHRLLGDQSAGGGVVLNLTAEQLAAMSEQELAELGRKRGLL